jgi:hypothetical protein
MTLWPWHSINPPALGDGRIDRSWSSSYYSKVRIAALPPRSMVGQLPLEQHIGVRIPGGQPMRINNLRCLPPSKKPVPNRSLSPRTVGARWFRACRYVSNSFQVFVQTDAIRESARDSANHSQESLVPRSCRPSQHLLLQPNRHSVARRRFGRGQ